MKKKAYRAYVKGRRAEYQLIRILQERGWAVIRAPASGRRSGLRPGGPAYPDIVAVKSGRTLVLEVKYRSRMDTVYLHERQVRILRQWAERSGGEAYVAVKLAGWKDFKIIPLDRLEPHETLQGKKYRIPIREIENAKWLTEIA